MVLTCELDEDVGCKLSVVGSFAFWFSFGLFVWKLELIENASIISEI